MLSFAATILLSSFLLFQVQPILAKILLPWFGGSAAVWTTCLLFFQTVLLLGYVYAHWSMERLGARRHLIVHLCLLGASLLALPVIPGTRWKPTSADDPSLRVLIVLAVAVGLPYFVLSSTGPLVQAWYGRSCKGSFPYRLFALSNLGSMLGLLSYPILVEPMMGTRAQAWVWSAAYGVFVAVCARTVYSSARQGWAPPAPGTGANGPPWLSRLLWVALAACASTMLLAVTNHLTQNVAPAPFLWIVPLSLYLLSFIICFDRPAWYKHGLFVWLTGAAIVALTLGILMQDRNLSLKLALPLFLGGLFVVCMFCHGELARRKPTVEHLTSFYLMVSAGGAMGGIFVGLIAPRLFPSYFEFPIGVVGLAAVGLLMLYRESFRAAVAWMALSVAVAISLAGYTRAFVVNSQFAGRNFYGEVRVTDDPGVCPGERVRTLMHGRVVHGGEAIPSGLCGRLNMYYAPDSGAGQVLGAGGGAPRRVGLVGLGAGMLASYARPGDTFRFYELNPLVGQVAGSWFSYLRGCAGRCELVLGDARLELEREAPQGFDILAVDAFSGDSIPVHLLTREAFLLYFHHLKPGGVLLLHATNMYVHLETVVAGVAKSLGSQCRVVNRPADQSRRAYKTTWIVITRSGETLSGSDLAAVGEPGRLRPDLQVWTDDYSNLFEVLRW